MTAPPPVLYADVSDLRAVLDSTDAGTGTAAQLTDLQLGLALEAASARFSTYAGTVYDGSSPQAAPPVLASARSTSSDVTLPEPSQIEFSGASR